MALPLPKVVADVGPGGPLVTALKGVNELTASNLDNKIKRIEAQYKPLTTQAEAASKLAYANLMGPQFLAKMLGNSDIAANLSENQLRTAIGTSYAAGTGQGTGNSIFGGNIIPQQQNINQNPFVMLLKQLFDKEEPQQGYNTFSNPNISSPNQNNRTQIPNPPRPQGSGVLMKDDGSVPSVPPRTTPNPNISFDASGQPILKDQNNGETYFERSGRQQGIKKEGEKLGEIRANDIGDFEKQYETGLKISDKYDTLTDLVNDKEFQNLRNTIPFFQDKQLKLLSKTGSPYQQELIGKFTNTANEIVADVIQSFGRQKFRGEKDVADGMKINENDTFNAMIGKMQSAMLYKELGMKRSSLAAEIMQTKHVNKIKALEMADKQIDGNKIRKDIADKLDYKVKIQKKKQDGTYEIQEVKRSEARKLGVPNV